MLTGQVIRERSLQTTTGQPFPIKILRPAVTAENRRLLAETSYHWLDQARQLNRSRPSQAHRAAFASDVAFLAASSLADQDPQHRILIATTADQQTVLGILMYRQEPPGWSWDLQTTRPENQPGWPLGGVQVRGIGNELSGAGLADIVATMCGPIHLDCLDRAACDHWSRLGFSGDPARGELTMSCPDARAAAARLANTEMDDPSRGEEVTATNRSLLRGISVLRY